MFGKIAAAAIFCAAAFAAATTASADIDYSALANPQTYKNVDTIYRSESGNSIARIRLKSMNFESRVKKWGIPIPQTLLIRTLTIDVYCRNLTDAEIQKLKAPPLFFIAAENFSLVLYGKRNKVTVRSNHALLKKDLSIVLTGDVKISTDKGQMSLGESATLSLNGRMLKFSYGENGEKFAIKF